MSKSLIGLIVLSICAGAARAAVLENVAANATGSGTLPVVALGQGVTSGIYDASMFAWLNGASSPRVFADTNLQPYMTWSTDQTIRTTRVWFDTTNVSPPLYDRLIIDTLAPGGNPTVEANWQQRYDTGTAYAGAFLDADLGADVTTRGLRVRAFKTTADINVGEVAVFKPILKPGTLTANRIVPTGATASSSSFGQTAAFAIDTTAGPGSGATSTGWYGRWLSDTTTANPGSTFVLTTTLPTDSAVNGVSVTFAPQPGFSALPSSWTILADYGSGFVPLSTFSSVGTRLQYYHDLGSGGGIDAIRLEVAESAVPAGMRVAVYELEAFNLPEPTMMGLALSACILARRRRRSCGTGF